MCGHIPDLSGHDPNPSEHVLVFMCTFPCAKKPAEHTAGVMNLDFVNGTGIQRGDKRFNVW
ncbi:hypothetical protein FACS1894172_04880 [Spirochaetia bacterium]|nr:hypothetical protein FACS1894164_05520 [Spirochaetia bacterium]GHU30888.1 hypothetical protein FACS1894172_04880 [Spirochaetia bacterium]